MYVEDRDSLERLQEVARERRNSRAWARTQAIVLAKQGDTAVRIAHCLGRSRRAVQTWVAAYNGGGLEALEERPHPGRMPILPRHEEGRFLEWLDAPRRTRMRSAPCGAPPSAASWTRNSPPATASTGSTSCSIGSSPAA